MSLKSTSPTPPKSTEESILDVISPDELSPEEEEAILYVLESSWAAKFGNGT
jgi:hypothetical protein